MRRSSRSYLIALLLGAFFVVVINPLGAATYSIERVSVNNSGVQGNWFSYFSSISGDGRFVVFVSKADNYVPGDTNNVVDYFVRDRQTGQTKRVSVTSSGAQGTGFPIYMGSSINADGRYITFSSDFTDLITGDNNGSSDVFVRDMQTGETKRVSISSAGAEGDGFSRYPSISSNGRYVAFESNSTNFAANDTNTYTDIFVHDRQTGETSRVSVSSNGTQATSSSRSPSISTDGRFVAWESNANNLVAGDMNGDPDVFLKDRQTGTTTLISVSSSGVQGANSSSDPSMSPDGRFVAFGSSSSNLVANDSNGFGNDIFLRDRQNNTTTLVSVSMTGGTGDGESYDPTVSADGRFVVFTSDSTDLVPNDTNGRRDVFVRDMQTGEISRVSVSNSGMQGNDQSLYSTISTDGRFINFESDATNLVPGDTNGVTDVFAAYNPLLPPPDPVNAPPLRNYFTAVPFTLTWNEVSWAVGYDVQIARTSTFTAASIVSTTPITTNTPHLDINALEDGVYYWRVCARKADNTCGQWSAAEGFTLDT